MSVKHREGARLHSERLINIRLRVTPSADPICAQCAKPIGDPWRSKYCSKKCNRAANRERVRIAHPRKTSRRNGMPAELLKDPSRSKHQKAGAYK